MATYETQKPSPGFFDFLWNPNIDSTRNSALQAEQQYFDVYGDYINKLKEYAQNYPDFRATLIKNGYMKGDGSLDFSKLTDKDYLANLDRVWKEDIVNQQQAQLQAVNSQAQKQGNIQSTAMQRGVNDSFGNARRNALSDYINQYKNEKNQAQNTGMQLTGQDVNTQIGKMNMDTNAAAQELNKAGAFANSQAETAAAQSKGFLQDPNNLTNLFTGNIGADVIGKGLGMIMGGGAQKQQPQNAGIPPVQTQQTPPINMANQGSPQGAPVGGVFNQPDYSKTNTSMANQGTPKTGDVNFLSQIFKSIFGG